MGINKAKKPKMPDNLKKTLKKEVKAYISLIIILCFTKNFLLLQPVWNKYQ